MSERKLPKRIWAVWSADKPPVLLALERADEIEIGAIAGVYELKERVRATVVLEKV